MNLKHWIAFSLARAAFATEMAASRSCAVNTTYFRPPTPFSRGALPRFWRPSRLIIFLSACRINDLPHGTPAYRHWQIFLESDAGIIPFLPKGRTWGSSFISRADSAPWCHTLEFYERFSRLWGGKDITYVASGSRSLTVSGLQASPHPPASVKYVEAPARQAWSQYARIKAECGKPQTVVMACGQVARVLGYELALAGTQVIDIGHFGIFFGLTALHEIGKYQWIHGQPIRQP